MRKPFPRIALATASILAIPAVMTMISDEWQWGVIDFLFMGALIVAAGLAYELLARQGGGPPYRVASAIAILASLFLIWVNAAVGIIGDGSHNLMFAGVLAIGLVGASLARLRPRGMMYTMFAMAAAQMLVPVMVLTALGTPFDPGVAPVFALNAAFALMFCGAGAFYRKART